MQRGEGKGERGEERGGERGERGEGRERRVWCCTLCDSRDFSVFSSSSLVFAIRPRSAAEGDAPSRFAPSRTLGLTPIATKRVLFLW